MNMIRKIRSLTGSPVPLNSFDSSVATPPDASPRPFRDPHEISSSELPSGERDFVSEVVLDQKDARIVMVSVESRAECAEVLQPHDYSVLAEVFFQDGSSNYRGWVPYNDGALHVAEYAPFSLGTHPWEKRNLTLKFSKPVKSLKIHLRFQLQTGRVWFREIKVLDLSRVQVPVFDTVPIENQMIPHRGFLLRDVAENSDYFEIRPDENVLGLTLSSEITKQDNDTVFRRVVIRRRSAGDRAVTLLFTIPLEGRDLLWYPNALSAVNPVLPDDYFDATPWGIGSNGFLSRFPFAAASSNGIGRAIGFDPDSPVFGRVGVNGATRELYLAWDVALTDEVPETEISFVEFQFHPEWGFRSALQSYFSKYPEAYRCRIHDQGIWMPFLPISKVENYEDFGFKFKEGDDEPEWDSAHGIYTFHYTEPMTCWMRMDQQTHETKQDVLQFQKALLQDEKNPLHLAAEIAETSAFYDESGSPCVLLMNRPWCNGGVFSINSMPGIPGKITDFNSKWNEAFIARHYAPNAVQPLNGGEYIDSTEGYVTAELDCRRDHFCAARVLCFAKQTFTPGIFKGNVVYEYIRAMADRLHPMNRYLMGNGTPGAMWFLPTLLDVPGTETDWNPDNQWTPPTVEELLFLRSCCAAKPYCFLMNTAFEFFTFEMVEKYMIRCLAFGMFPSFFSANAATGHYFSDPVIYQRDRVLFKHYIPLIRQVAEAGWEPVTLAATTSALHLERFGEKYLTVFNPSDHPVTGLICFDEKSDSPVQDLLTGHTFSLDNAQLELTLEPEHAALLKFL